MKRPASAGTARNCILCHRGGWARMSFQPDVYAVVQAACRVQYSTFMTHGGEMLTSDW